MTKDNTLCFGRRAARNETACPLYRVQRRI